MSEYQFDLPKVETMQGSEKGSTFVVFAKAGNLKMGIRAFPSAHQTEDQRAWAALGIRLRVETVDGSSCSAEMAGDAFGYAFNFYESGHHSSSMMLLPLVEVKSTSPVTLYTAYSNLPELENNLVEQIGAMFKPDVKFTLAKEDIALLIKERIEDFIPDTPTVYYGTSEFIVINPKKQGGGN